jgi:hypothetical protein
MAAPSEKTALISNGTDAEREQHYRELKSYQK